MGLSRCLSSKKIGIMKLPGFVKLQLLGTTLKNFVISSNYPLFLLKFFFKLKMYPYKDYN